MSASGPDRRLEIFDRFGKWDVDVSEIGRCFVCFVVHEETVCVNEFGKEEKRSFYVYIFKKKER